MKWFNLLFITLVFTLSFGIVYAVEPPQPEPPVWDKSSLKIEGECDNYQPIFKITNVGSAMAGESTWYLLNEEGGASTCAADVAAGYELSNTFVLGEGMEFYVQITPSGYSPPYRMCVSQRPGHPGVGWASATVNSDCVKPTGLEEVEEPFRRLYLPEIRGN